MDSVFSPEQFLSTQYNNKTDTRLIPVPADEYNGQILKIAARRAEGKDGSPNYILDVTWEVLDDRVKQVTGLDHPSARQSIFLDVTAEGSIDMGRGRSVQLGRLREAVGQNADGKPWSPQMLVGAMARIVVTNRADSENPENVYSDVKRVTNIK